jgi:hypothetical protein
VRGGSFVKLFLHAYYPEAGAIFKHEDGSFSLSLAKDPSDLQDIDFVMVASLVSKFHYCRLDKDVEMEPASWPEFVKNLVQEPKGVPWDWNEIRQIKALQDFDCGKDANLQHMMHVFAGYMAEIRFQKGYYLDFEGKPYAGEADPPYSPDGAKDFSWKLGQKMAQEDLNGC